MCVLKYDVRPKIRLATQTGSSSDIGRRVCETKTSHSNVGLAVKKQYPINVAALAIQIAGEDCPSRGVHGLKEVLDNQTQS